MRPILLSLLVLVVLHSCAAWSDWHNSNCRDGRVALVHLFEWKWTDIEYECVNFLAPMGYCGVQVSPPMEHVLIDLPEAERPWWQRYQPVSYKLESRSGTRQQFISMVETCNDAGVNIYVDAVINHMAGMDREGTGSGGSYFSTKNEQMDFPGVPFTTSDFNGCDNCGGCCCINAWQDHAMVRNCRLLGLSDIKMDQASSRGKVAGYMNDLIDIGVAGFRVDAAKHMWPADLQTLWGELNNLNTRWFPGGSKPFMALEVLDLNQQGEVSVWEYNHLGRPTELRYCNKISQAALYLNDIFTIYDPGWGMLSSEDAFVFVDNHDNQRGHGSGGSVVTHKDPYRYKIAQAITLSYTYGFPRVMSSYQFDNGDIGPPMAGAPTYDTLDAIADKGVGGGRCHSEVGWVCEHRWQEIAGMASFAKAVSSAGDNLNVYLNDNNRVAYSRGGRGFIYISNTGTDSMYLQTGLPSGLYCDVIAGCPSDQTSNGCLNRDPVGVDNGGMAIIQPLSGDSPMVALHIEAMAFSNGCTGIGEPPVPGSTLPPTTPGPTTPPPEGYQKTTIFLYALTQVGQDLFLRGGIDHAIRPGICDDNDILRECAVSIVHRSIGTSSHYDKYNTWRVGDAMLDWHGTETGQGSYMGQAAQGTPMAWTSNQVGNDGYQPDNRWGDHYWKVEVDMDCSECEDGWFEVKGYRAEGSGGLWENDISQYSSCTGTAGGQRPYISGNHMGRCGKLNVFHWGLGDCMIDNY